MIKAETGNVFFTNCIKCGKECGLPFYPHPNVSVYCQECYAQIQREPTPPMSIGGQNKASFHRPNPTPKPSASTAKGSGLGKWVAIIIVLLMVLLAYNDYTSEGNMTSGFLKGINDIIFPTVYSQELWVSNNVYEAYANGSACYATIYTNATDPTYAQLMAFLKQDDTEYVTYVPGQYECTNFAIHLSDDAERVGIKAHIVRVDFGVDNINPTPGASHLLNAFNTTDQGMIYVDDTGREEWQKEKGMPISPATTDIKIGTQYQRVLLYPVLGWSSTDNPIGTISSYSFLD